MKIGVFDSGVGGLTILKELVKNYPYNHYIYVGDNKNCPYGDKTKKELFSYATRIINYFISQNISLIIIGCNTICSNIFLKLKNEYPNINLIGVVDATVNSFITLNKKEVLIIGTTKTIKSGVYAKKIKAFDRSIKITSLATPKLVPMIENNEDVKEVLDNYLKPYNKISNIILACTHYKLITKYLNKYNVINSSDGVLKEVKSYIKSKDVKKVEIYTTGNVYQFNLLCSKIMGRKAKKINLER